MSAVLSRIGGIDKSAIGVAGIFAFFAIFALVFLNIPQSLFTTQGETVSAVFTNPGQLSKGDPVRVSGVTVGKVTAIELLPNGGGTQVDMDVSKAGLPLYRNARADVRWRTLLGAAFVVNIDRGTPASGTAADNATIPASRTSNQIEVDQLTDIGKGGAKGGIRKTLKALPQALANSKAPAQALDGIAGISPGLAASASSLRGQSPGEITTMVQNTARVVRALDTPTEDIRRLVGGGASTLAVTARRASDIQDTIDEANRVMPNIRTTVQRLDTTLKLADPLVAALQKPATQIAPTADHLRPTLISADRLLGRARPLLSALRPAAKSLAAASVSAQPVLDHLEPDLKLIDDKLLPDLARRSPDSGRTTYEMLGPTFEALHVPFSAYDANGYFVRFLAGVGSDVADFLPCRTLISDPDATSLATCDNLKDVIARAFGATFPAPTRSR